MSRFCRKIVNARFFHPTVIGVIIVASVIIGLETSEGIMDRHGELLSWIDAIILAVFAVEILLRLGAYGARPWRFFRDPWNVFDFTIVALCFLPATGPYAAALRLVRILRVLRLITVLPRLQVIVMALLRSIPSMGFIALLLFLHFYIYAVVGTFLFGNNDPMHFGTLGDSFLSLFRAVTLEDWTDLMYIQMYGSDVYPIFNYSGPAPEPQAFRVMSPVYFITFILFGTMIVLNLFIGVVVNSLHEAQLESELITREKHRARTGHTSAGDDVRELEHRLEELQKALHLVRRKLEKEVKK